MKHVFVYFNLPNPSHPDKPLTQFLITLTHPNSPPPSIFPSLPATAQGYPAAHSISFFGASAAAAIDRPTATQPRAPLHHLAAYPRSRRSARPPTAPLNLSDRKSVGAQSRPVREGGNRGAAHPTSLSAFFPRYFRGPTGLFPARRPATGFSRETREEPRGNRGDAPRRRGKPVFDGIF